MTKRDSDAPSDDGIVAEDMTQLMEHVELTGDRPLMSGPAWELAKPVEDLEDAPVFVDNFSELIPDLETVEAAEDLELFTETELDLNQRLLQVEDEQLELAAGIGAERMRWQRRVATLRADMAERNRLLAEHEQEIEDLSARLATMAVERDSFVEELRDLQRSVGRVEILVDQRALSPADSVIASLHERLRERSNALLVMREEIDGLRAEREQLVAAVAERGEFIKRLHVRLRELEGEDHGGGELRKLMRRFFGGEQKPEAPAADAPVAAAPVAVAPVAAALTTEVPILDLADFESTVADESPAALAALDATVELPVRQVIVEDMRQAPPHLGPPVSAHSEPRIRRYLIGLDMVGSVYEMTLPRVNVGRTRDNDLRIVDPTVSRLHAVLHARGREVTVIDANSCNGIYVNGIQLRYATLEDGDTLTFGAVRFRYRVGSGNSGGAHGPD
jgi:FHA domain-containing protein